MDTIDRIQLDQLVATTGGPHVTVFLPAPLRPMEAKDDAIRISNMARDAIVILKEHWMPEQEGEGFVKPLRDLAEDEAFLADRRHGVAIFLSENCFKVYRFEDSSECRMWVDRVFHVRPLLPALNANLNFAVLRLSKKRVTLFSATPAGISEMELEGLPESFEASLAGVSADRGSQTHSAANASGAAGKQAAVFHGQGGLPDAEKAELTEYLRHVDNAICSALAKRLDWLVLAGVDYETAIFRSLSCYPRIATGSISGNMDHLLPAQLIERATPIAAAAIGNERNAEAEQIRQRRYQPVATDPEKVLKAACKGQVKTLFLDQNARLSGSFDPSTEILKEMPNEPTGEPGDPCHDLIELAAVQTLTHGGRVYSVAASEMPADVRMVAALRY